MNLDSIIVFSIILCNQLHFSSLILLALVSWTRNAFTESRHRYIEGYCYVHRVRIQKVIMRRKLLFNFHTHIYHLGISQFWIEIQEVYNSHILSTAISLAILTWIKTIQGLRWDLGLRRISDCFQNSISLNRFIIHQKMSCWKNWRLNCRKYWLENWIYDLQVGDRLKWRFSIIH